MAPGCLESLLATGGDSGLAAAVTVKLSAAGAILLAVDEGEGLLTVSGSFSATRNGSSRAFGSRLTGSQLETFWPPVGNFLAAGGNMPRAGSWLGTGTCGELAGSRWDIFWQPAGFFLAVGVGITGSRRRNYWQPALV